MRIMVGVGDLVQRTGDGHRYSVSRRSRGWVALGAVCTVHVEMKSAVFLVEPKNQGRWFISGLASKSLGRFLIGLGLKTDGDGL
jgi:hypothetical protein